MALSNINPQTFTVPEKQVLLYKLVDATYYKRYTGTTGTLDDKTLKALGIAKLLLPCLIYDADLLRGLNASLANVDSVTVATSYKASLLYIKQASHKKLDKHTYLNDQVHVKLAITLIDNRFDTLTKLQQVVTQLTDNKIVVPKKAIPIAIKTNKGTLYNIDFRYLELTLDNYVIDPNVYLAYDNQAAFAGTWYVYYAGFFSKTIHEDRAGVSIKNIQQPVIKLEHNKVVKHTIVLNLVLTLNTDLLVLDKAVTMELWLTMPETVVSFSIPDVTWIEEPSFDTGNMLYCVVLRWDGARVLANVSYSVGVS